MGEGAREKISVRHRLWLPNSQADGLSVREKPFAMQDTDTDTHTQTRLVKGFGNATGNRAFQGPPPGKQHRFIKSKEAREVVITHRRFLEVG